MSYRLDSDGSAVAVELPGPAYVASWISLGREVEAFRRGSAIVARPLGSDVEPEPLDVRALAEDLLQVLADLPERPDAERPYRDLRLAAATGSPRLRDYCLDVLRAFRSVLPPEPARPRPPRRRRGPAKSHAEICRDSRARLRADEEASVEAWLDVWLDPEDPPAPGRYLAADLHAEAVEVLAEWRDGGETLPDGREIREPGPRTFTRVLDRRLGRDARHRTKHGNAYTITEDTMRRNPLFTREEVLAEIARQERAEMREAFGRPVLADVPAVESPEETFAEWRKTAAFA